MIAPPHERRAHARAPHTAAAILTTRRGDIQADVFDLSVGGLGLRTAAPLQRGEFIRVRVQLPTERGPTWFDPDAVVSRVEQGTGRSTIGVAFVNPPPNLQEVLAARVSAHASRPPRRTKPAPRPMAQAPVRPTKSSPKAKTSTPKPMAAPAPDPPAPRVSRRELAELFRSALASVADDPRSKKKRRGRS